MGTENKIKLYGFGVVGQGFQSYLAKNEDAKRLHTIIVKDDSKKRKNVESIIETTNPQTARDKDMEVILELISSSEEAYGIVAENLEIGKKVISANKKLIAENLEKLIQKEQENNGTFLYEGAVCGSIPIIRVLNDLYANEPVKSVKGIFNGSSNYILSQLFSREVSYKEALIQAQELGFAEADPTSDVGGFDALYKLIIITAHAFGKIIKPETVLNIGIENISKTDIEFAKKNNLKIKLIAKAAIVENQLTLTVLPTLINRENDLYNVENEFNGVLIDAENIGQQFYKGKVAWSLPTGSVVYSDLKAIDSNYSYSYKKLNKQAIQLLNDEVITVVLTVKNVIDIETINVNGLWVIDGSQKQFLAKTSIAELKQQNQKLQNIGASVLVIEDENLINELKNASRKEEALIL